MVYKPVKKRRRQARTNYKKRIALLKGGLPRVVVRKSNRGILTQIVSYEISGDRIVAQANSRELRALGWSPRRNLPTAYLTGLLLSRKAKGMKDLIADTGLYRPIKSSVIFAALKGCIDGGMKVRANIEIDMKRITGTSISNYANMIKGKEQGPNKQFSQYAAEKFDVAKMPELFDSTKRKILEGK